MSSEPDLAAKVHELWDREAIRRCLHRHARGIDRFDRDAILSAFHLDSLDGRDGPRTTRCSS